jgi:hypothetical protein
MRRYIVLLLITGIAWAQTDFDTLVLKNGTVYFGEFSTIDGDNVFFKPKGASDFQSISIKQIKTLELKFGQIVIAPGLKIEAKYQNEFINKNNNNKKNCLIATIFIIAGVGLIIDGFDLGLNFGGGGSGHPSF